MATKAVLDYDSGETIVAVFSEDDQVALSAGSGLETYNASNWDTYTVLATVLWTQGGQSRYIAAVPAGITKRNLSVAFYSRTGTVGAYTYVFVASGGLEWDGSKELETPTAAAIADAVLDEALADHNTEDTLGNVINDLTEESGGVYRLTAAALGTAPTGSTATYSVSTTTIGAAPRVDIVAYQYAAFGPYSITASTAQTGDSHSFLVYNPNAPATVLWSLTTDGGEISVGGSGNLTITLTDTDTHMSTAGVYAYVLRNTTDDTVVCEGSLTIEERPNVPA